MLELSLKLYAACAGNLLFGLPHWAEGLSFDNQTACNIINFSLSDIWTVVANIARITLGIAGYLAIIFIIVGGIMFITSQGNPDRLKIARSILTNAILGLVIAVLASAIVGFIAGRF